MCTWDKHDQIQNKLWLLAWGETDLWARIVHMEGHVWLLAWGETDLWVRIVLHGRLCLYLSFQTVSLSVRVESNIYTILEFRAALILDARFARTNVPDYVT